MELVIDRDWLQPGFTPATMTAGPFVGVEARPRFFDIYEHALADDISYGPWDESGGSLQSFAARLVEEVELQLLRINGPIHCLLSGGYDSRILAKLLELNGRDPLYVTDGTEEPECAETLDLLGVPASRRYVHDLDQHDPYGLVDAVCEGWAPLYSQMRFMPAAPAVTLVTGLGGGEWFSYPAGGWHRGKQHRLPHISIVNQWLDCWPQYALLPDAWARGYKAAVHPYCTLAYAEVANRCRTEWLVEVKPWLALDAVRLAMLDSLDIRLAPIGWVPHDYDWKLTESDCEKIDERFHRSWLAQTFELDCCIPSAMDGADWSCTMGGFATWCDKLIEQGAKIS